jgi:hypothetical protein
MRAHVPPKLVLAAALAAAACQPAPAVPENPTWAQVEPIMRARCNHCHGASARTTAAVGGLVYRFDFFEMTEGVCGAAAAGLESPGGMARGWSAQIRTSIVAPGGGRARMPPAPAEPLDDWERETILRWAAQPFPPLGFPREGNRRPQIRLEAPRLADANLRFTALVEDPDGEPVVGVLSIGEATLRMERAGSFSTTLSTSTWPAGRYPISAVLCDGWDSAAYRLDVVDVVHSDAQGAPMTFGTP